MQLEVLLEKASTLIGQEFLETLKKHLNQSLHVPLDEIIPTLPTSTTKSEETISNAKVDTPDTDIVPATESTTSIARDRPKRIIRKRTFDDEEWPSFSSIIHLTEKKSKTSPNTSRKNTNTKRTPPKDLQASNGYYNEQKMEDEEHQDNEKDSNENTDEEDASAFYEEIGIDSIQIKSSSRPIVDSYPDRRSTQRYDSEDDESEVEAPFIHEDLARSNNKLSMEDAQESENEEEEEENNFRVNHKEEKEWAPSVDAASANNNNNNKKGGRNRSKGAQKRTLVRWTPEEDEILRKLYAEYEPLKLRNKWILIAAKMEGKNSQQCFQHWKRVLDPAINKRPWTPEEEATLIELVKAYPSGMWSKISSKMNGRTDIQCRYQHRVLEKGRRLPWKEEEDTMLRYIIDWQQKGKTKDQNPAPNVAANDTNEANVATADNQINVANEISWHLVASEMTKMTKMSHRTALLCKERWSIIKDLPHKELTLKFK